LSGRSLALHAADLGWTFVVEPHAGGVRVLAQLESPPDVRLSAPTLRLLGLAAAAAGGSAQLPAGLDIQGDTELLRRFNAILARVGFDPEELVARLLGDGAAHRLVGGVRGLLGWGRHAAGRLSQDTAEYLTEETGDLARGGDIADWMDRVDALREAADRFEARLALLERQAQETAA
jgi:ubiquinone biosynthesis protein UbiJ